MFSDGLKYAYKHLKLRKSCSFGNWSSSNGREYFLIAYCKFIATCLPEKVKNSEEDWQNDIISWPRNTKWSTVELYKEKHVALLIIAKFLATTPVMATRTLQICIFWLVYSSFPRLLFSSFPRREISRFAVIWTTVSFLQCVGFVSIFLKISKNFFRTEINEFESPFPILTSGASEIGSVSHMAR